MAVSKRYVYEKIRKGVGHSRQLVVLGYADAKFPEEYTISCIWRRQGVDKELSVECKSNQTTAFHTDKITGITLDRRLAICIDFAFKVLQDDEFRVCAKDACGQELLLYRCKGATVIRELHNINYSIDAKEAEEKKFVLRGWAIDDEKISFSAKNRRTGEAIALPEGTPQWHARGDVAMYYPEYENPVKIGFTLVLPLEQCGDKMTLCIQAGSRVKEIPITVHSKLDEIKPVAKVSRGITKVVNSVKTAGLKTTCVKTVRYVQNLKNHRSTDYDAWIRKRLVTPEELERQKTQIFAYQPKFSILVPLYESDFHFLDELIVSVKEQSYSNWELCFSDGSKDKARLTQFLAPYMEKDSRIKLISEQEGPLPIPENTNQALRIASGEYIVLGDHDDLFTPDALYECVKVLNDKKVQVIYTDEDKVDQSGKLYFEPHFKPDFNLDLLRSDNYICHMFVVEKALVDKVGSFVPEFNGAQDYDFILRCTEQADGIYHIPKVLYHWRSHKNSTASAPEAKLYAFEAGRKAVQAHLDRLGIEGTVEDGEHLGYYKTSYKIQGHPLISIVIPNKDHVEDLRKCIDSIENKSTYRNYEILIVENNSTELETFAYYAELDGKEHIRVLYWKEGFNYSAINNFAVAQAKGEYILLLNNDTEIMNEDCLEQLLGYCQREEVGAVGARLYFADGSIQHAGVVIGLGGVAGHPFSGIFEELGVYHARSKVACDYSAVTAACLMTKKSIYEEVGGLDEGYKVAFNDVDFCLKIRELGKLVVYNPYAKLYHYESKSRGMEDTPEKQIRFNEEVERMKSRWPEILEKGDPYYNPNLTLTKGDYSVKME